MNNNKKLGLALEFMLLVFLHRASKWPPRSNPLSLMALYAPQIGSLSLEPSLSLFGAILASGADWELSSSARRGLALISR